MYIFPRFNGFHTRTKSIKLNMKNEQKFLIIMWSETGKITEFLGGQSQKTNWNKDIAVQTNMDAGGGIIGRKIILQWGVKHSQKKRTRFRKSRISWNPNEILRILGI